MSMKLCSLLSVENAGF